MVDRLRQQSDELETLKKDVDKLKSELQASESEGGSEQEEVPSSPYGAGVLNSLNDLASESEGGSEQEEVPSSPYGAGVLNSPNDLWEKLHSVAEYTHSKKGEDNQLAGKKDEWLAKQCEEGDSNRVEEHQKIEAVGKTKHGKVAEIQRQRELEVEEKEMLRREALAWPVPAATATKPTPGR